jgi:hypothetical protein
VNAVYVGDGSADRREVWMKELKDKVVEKAVAAGAERDSISIVEVEEVPLSYAGPNTCRLRMKAVGDLAPHFFENKKEEEKVEEREKNAEVEEKQEKETENEKEKDSERIAKVSAREYKPEIDPLTNEWIVSETDIEYIACGGCVLGTGGGGDPYLGNFLFSILFLNLFIYLFRLC